MNNNIAKNLFLSAFLLGLLSLWACQDHPASPTNDQLDSSVQLSEEDPGYPRTGEVLNRAVFMTLKVQPNYQWDGSQGNLPAIISGQEAFDRIHWANMEIDPAIPDYLQQWLNQPGSKAVRMTEVPSAEEPGRMENHIYIDLRHSPAPKPFELEGTPGIFLPEEATPNAGCTKTIIKIGYDGPAKDFCACMPHYGCYDDCPNTCGEESNIREYVMGLMGPHPLLDIEVPFAEIEPGIELSSLYP